MTFTPTVSTDWQRQIARNMEMDLTQPTYAARTSSDTAAAVPAAQATVPANDVVIPITLELYGEVLDRKQYRYNQAEARRIGPSYVQGG